ncbi:uncharacterized protein BX664DRAFT_357588 [Halteromyces radiatus]|uniref:uncharacterized protein n=1 Tax=Halteromyces radiatus TaxID=101107 RepID=UPI00221FDE2F|nr:uncharacterized protein BX664DRAFT_357588 [Halteromyces radiatus]KAI8093114.1 hypothetical protein BX664DRAFT_357588 [Halteromyces radiatus]
MLAESYLILWASQTGSAEWIAKNIHSEAAQRGYKGTCVLMDDYEKSTIDTAGVIIFVSSNTGDGDPPDNALKFWRFLRRNKDKNYFADRQITLLGLGDTNYSNFNNTVKRIEKKCKELGATIFYEKGLADDAEGLENVVDPWIEKLWDALPKVLESSGAPAETSIDKVTETLKTTTISNSTTPDQPVDPYSMKGRKTTLPNGVEKYLDLPNSLVEKKTIKQVKTGKALELDYSGLVPGIKLTNLPKATAPTAQWTSLAQTISSPLVPGQVPEFVVTPTPLVYAPISSVKCLTTDDAVKRTLLMELQIDDEELNFEPGDAFGVIAPNDEELVHALIARLAPSITDGYETLHDVNGENLPSHLQKAKSVTMADILRYGVDLTSSPRKALLRMLADHTTDVDEKTRLMYICSKQGLSQFNAVRDQTPTLLDILTTFPSCQPPVSRLLDLLPPHQPRYYSMASSPLKHRGKLQFVFNVVEYTTEKGVQRQGVATPWLDILSGKVPFKNQVTDNNNNKVLDSVKIPIFTRPNNAFVLPKDTTRPLILVGPGTGIAPLRGFVQHRQAQRLIRQKMGGVGSHPNRDILKEFGSIHVYDGCRDRSKDYLFEEEWDAFVKDGTATSVKLAISRPQDISNKMYVQDLMKQDGAFLYDLIVNKDAAIYVCGDAKGMAKGVNDCLVDILGQYEQMDALAANKKLMEWMTTGKYLRDLWA